MCPLTYANSHDLGQLAHLFRLILIIAVCMISHISHISSILVARFLCVQCEMTTEDFPNSVTSAKQV